MLLRAGTETIDDRLAQREIGSDLPSHIERSRRAAAELDAAAPDWVQRVETEGRSVVDIAASIAGMLAWTPLAEDL